MDQKQNLQNHIQDTAEGYDWEKREARRKRRQRSQVAAYLSVCVIILLLTIGIVAGIGALSKRMNIEEESQQVQQSVVEDLLSEEAIEMPDPEEIIIELTPEQKLDEIVNAGIEVMPLEDKVAGLFVVTPEAITGVSAAIQAGEGTQQALAQYAVGGIVYFGKNMESKEQLQKMIENTQLFAKYPLFIAVDEEGGSVSRVAGVGLAEKSDSAQAIRETGDTNNAYQAGVNIGTYLSELGFNLNFAPVADLANVENSIMSSRAYGVDAESAIPFVTAMMQGLEEQGVTACLKHFPGIGSSTQDPHEGRAVSDRSIEDFRAHEFRVFQAGIEAGVDMIMAGPVSAPALTGDNTPVCLSKDVITGMLREEMGYQGVIITDALNIAAVSEYYSSEQAAVMALKAGCDMVLMPENFEEAYNGVLQAVRDGIISEERVNDSLRRIYRIKYADKITE